MPVGLYRAGVLTPGLDNFSVFMVRVSPANREGYVSFGESLIISKPVVRRADLITSEQRLKPTAQRVRVQAEKVADILEREQVLLITRIEPLLHLLRFQASVLACSGHVADVAIDGVCQDRQHKLLFSLGRNATPDPGEILRGQNGTELDAVA